MKSQHGKFCQISQFRGDFARQSVLIEEQLIAQLRKLAQFRRDTAVQFIPTEVKDTETRVVNVPQFGRNRACQLVISKVEISDNGQLTKSGRDVSGQ